MKTLKLQHHLAQKVQAGTKTATWRLYDDKNLSVNDIVELVDKVDPGNPDTWQVIGTAKIQMIVEKRLGDLAPEDYMGHETFGSSKDMLKTYKDYYGPQVTKDTPVKMIHFTLEKPGKSTPAKKNVSLKEAKMYADGGSRGNPGPSASGFVILDMNGEVVVKKGVYLGITTNNQAEYQALKFGVEEARKMGIQTLHVHMDSLLVVNQMLGIFKVKNRDLWPIHEAIKQTALDFKKVSYTHVPRELNKLADSAVNETLDATLAKQ